MSLSTFSPSRLQRLDDVLASHVESGAVPGMVALVSRRGETHAAVLGSHDKEGTTAMRRDTIFRIASLTKPIAAVAAMILLEECRLRLDDSIDDLLPELSNRQVLKHIGAELDDTVPANRALTLRDLLTFRMGFGSVMAMPGTYPIQTAVKELRLGSDGPPNPAQDPSRDEWLKGLARLPLMHQPGEKWMYHTSADLLGLLIERASGQTFGAFLRERIFEPLGMKDTAFWVPPAKIERLPSCYFGDQITGELQVYDDGKNSQWSQPPDFESGGGGLVSTADDYLNFCQMMLGKGRLGEARILSRPSVELMTSDQLTPEQRSEAGLFFGQSTSWGLGLSVAIHRDQLWNNPGRFGWDGGLGTSGYTDPKEELIGVLLTQRMMDSPQPPKVFTDFWTGAYQAIED